VIDEVGMRAAIDFPLMDELTMLKPEPLERREEAVALGAMASAA
jgi:hypothetical protein